MNAKLAKKLRKMTRRNVLAGQQDFLKTVSRSPVMDRVIFALRLVFNVWPKAD